MLNPAAMRIVSLPPPAEITIAPNEKARKQSFALPR
jgi:hypothetical protein